MKKHFYAKELFICLLLLLLHNLVMGQWEYLGSPDHGTGKNISGPSDSLFLSSTAGVFFSSDKGLSWTELDLPDTAAHIREAWYANGALYVAATEFLHFSGRSNLYRTYNLGATWTDISPATSQTNSFRVHRVKGDTLVVLYSDAVAVSTDKGDSFLIRSDDNASGYGFPVFLNKQLFVNSDSLILRSDDYGQTWDTIFVMPAGHGPSVFKAIENTLWLFQTTYFGYRIEIFRSDDGGDTWDTVSEFIPLAESYVLLAGTNDNLFIYHTSFTGIYHSIDTGKTWQLINPSGYLYHMHYTDDVILGYDATTVYRSEDNALTFTQSGDGFDAVVSKQIAVTDSRVFIATQNEVFSKKEKETTWTGSDYIRTVFTIGNIVFSKHDQDGIVYSPDGGTTWLRFTKDELSGVMETYFAELFAAGSRLYSSGFGRTWYSDNLGHSWQKIEDEDLAWKTIQLLAHDDGKYVALAAYNEILFSDDGIDWKLISYDYPVDTSFIVPDATFVHHAFGNSFVFKNQTFQRLPDGSTHWIEVNHPVPASNEVPQEHTIEFLESHGDFLIIGVFGYGVFISNDLGESWVPANEGLSDFHITSATIHQQDLYIGVLGGIWKRSLKDLGVTSLHPEIAGSPSPFRVSPNLVSEQLKITQSSQMDEIVFLEMIDATGRVFHSGKWIDGYSESVSTELLPAGKYYIRISTKSGVYMVPFVKI